MLDTRRTGRLRSRHALVAGGGAARPRARPAPGSLPPILLPPTICTLGPLALTWYLPRRAKKTAGPAHHLRFTLGSLALTCCLPRRSKKPVIAKAPGGALVPELKDEQPARAGDYYNRPAGAASATCAPTWRSTSSPRCHGTCCASSRRCPCSCGAPHLCCGFVFLDSCSEGGGLEQRRDAYEHERRTTTGRPTDTNTKQGGGYFQRTTG